MESFTNRYPEYVSDTVTQVYRAKSQLISSYPGFKGSQALAMLTAILELGAFVGSLMAGPMADILSRKVSWI